AGARIRSHQRCRAQSARQPVHPNAAQPAANRGAAAMKRASVLIAAVLLSGCISLLPKAPPPPRTFLLSAGDVARAQGAPIAAVMAVAAPTGDRALLGAEMAWNTGDELAYVDHTQWSAHADDALQAMLVETLSRQGRFRAAGRTGETAAQYE